MTRDAGTLIRKRSEEHLRELAAKFPPNPFSFHADKISRVRYCPEIPSILNVPSGQRNIRFAFISLHRPSPEDYVSRTILNKKDRRKHGLDRDACDRMMVHYDVATARALLASYEWGVAEALEGLKANIVCVNELGFPSRRGEPYRRAIDFSRRKAEEHKAVIVAGSFHDARTKYNSGYIFFPKDETEVLPGGTPYHKQVSATEVGKKDGELLTRTGEYISVPPERASVNFTAYGLSICVIVCLDLMDYSAVANVVRLQDAVDILLVPSCSENTEAMNKMAKLVSRSMPGGVGIVNYFRKRQVTSTLYLFDRKDEEECRRIRNIPNDGGKVFAYDIPYTDFKKEKRGKQNHLDYHTSLFGLPVRVALQRQ